MINDILLSSNKAKGKRPYFLEDQAVERVLNITMAVASEVAVLHERLDTIERLLSSKNILQTYEIETFTPNPVEAEERQRWHASYVARVLRIVQQELEALQQDPKNNRSMEEIAEELGRI
ncbi:MAG: hypothetical protein U5N85_06045 [Arcicella sp.]|nr:hypothetical protein [Arcicella sp.]